MAPVTRSSKARNRQAKKSNIIVEVVIEQQATSRRREKKKKKQLRRIQDDASTAKRSAITLIDKLPNEILVNMFENLSWKERRTCQLVCQFWNSVILESPTLWMDPPHIKGSLSKIAKKLTGRLGELSGGGKFRKLSLSLDTFKTYQESIVSKEFLAKRFPSSSLQQLACTRSNDRQIDGGEESSPDNAKLWSLITSCSQLKVLHWRSKEDEGGSDTDIDYCLNTTRLSACRLEEATFDIPYQLDIDDSFLHLLSQVKCLDINARFSSPQLKSIFEIIKDTVVDFTFTNYTDDLPSWDYYDELEASMLARSVHMPKLKRLNAAFTLMGSEYSRIQLPSPYQIIAPRITSLSFLRLNSIDWALIESCRSTLESFCVGTGGQELPVRLQQELFNMPALLDLTLDLTNDNNSDYRCNTEYRFYTFWNAIDQGDTWKADIRIQDVLPRLTSLTIVADTDFTFKRAMGLLQLRKRLGLTQLESMTIWLDEHCDHHKESIFSTAEIDKLKLIVPIVEIKGGKDIYETGLFCDVQCNRDWRN